MREEFRTSFNNIGRKNSLAGKLSESMWLGYSLKSRRSYGLNWKRFETEN